MLISIPVLHQLGIRHRSSALLDRVPRLIGAVGLFVCLLPVLAHEASKNTADPGFRPFTEFAPAFVLALDTATVAVYPSIVRRAQKTSYSVDSQRQIVSLLNAAEMTAAMAEASAIDPGRLKGNSQWDVFQNDMHSIAEEVIRQDPVAEYSFVMAFLFPPGGQSVFGIHCYVFDHKGRNVFSFLLNAHHQLFVDADLRAGDASKAGRARVLEKATTTGVAALRAQIDQARARATHTVEPGSAEIETSVVDDFDAGLPSGRDGVGNPVGFRTLGDATSTAHISTTAAHPPRPGEAEGNRVLKVNLNVTGRAGFVHAFENDAKDRWVSCDWISYDEISLWLYGNNSGTSLFVDVLDNRKRYSTSDDAERYTYAFTDDFAGWKKIIIPFAHMVRKDVGNGAPNDGLGLSEVHGWAFGTLRTSSEISYHIDGVELRAIGLVRLRPVAAGEQVEYAINELPTYGGHEKSVSEMRADEEFIETITKRFRSRAEAAEHFARIGWNIFYEGDLSTAIKRFNQAWLLDPGNQHALWGFAGISLERGQFEHAVRYCRMAIENGPENPALRRDFEKAQSLVQR